MMFNKSVKLDEIKQKIGAKITRRCGRRMSELFYKFPVQSNPCKIRRCDKDDDVKTMITLYYSHGNIEPIELFVELADVESL
ncbi:hypothetical protein J1N35_029548 [Gossypium stocksii]|uniref:Uncharacterized protein n=1 Tax=Gossypium stocksii TaxID=47602 RepID=A0A9D3UY56_9ROSI|nr:hypothetical protein J1N35_029548 [Gossypium stocksii]